MISILFLFTLAFLAAVALLLSGQFRGANLRFGVLLFQSSDFIPQFLKLLQHLMNLLLQHYVLSGKLSIGWKLFCVCEIVRLG